MDDTMLTGSSKTPTREQVVRLAQDDPVIRAALMYWQLGRFTFEEALILAVTTQAKQIESISAELKKCMEHYPLV